MAAFTFTGASGARYECPQLPWDAPAQIPRSGGILILASGTHMDPHPVLILDDGRLQTLFFKISTLAATNFGAHLLYVRLQNEERLRAPEARDLIAAYNPLMNAKASPA